MQINFQKFNEVAKAAKARTNDKRWQNAIDKAQAGVTSGWWVITELANCVAVTTETGRFYRANAQHCQCEAFFRGQPCKHRSLYRLLTLYNAMGAVVLAVGGLLAWLGVAFMRYSDSADRQLAHRVSVLDSITLICVLAHFSFLAWTFGHLKTIQSAEARYEAQATAYNAQARQVSTDNVKIAEAAQAIATENRKRAKLETDTAYQQRRAVEAGGRVPYSRSTSAPGVGPGLSTSAVELERPTKPGESSAQFLSRWDSAIRLANLAELLLAAVTLIYIRVRSSKTNSPGPAMDFSPLLSVAGMPRVGLSCNMIATMTEPNEPAKPSTPMDEFIADWGKSVCRTCDNPLDLQQREPLLLFCPICLKWFDGELERL
jgi:hypothetical protein